MPVYLKEKTVIDTLIPVYMFGIEKKPAHFIIEFCFIIATCFCKWSALIQIMFYQST